MTNVVFDELSFVYFQQKTFDDEWTKMLEKKFVKVFGTIVNQSQRLKVMRGQKSTQLNTACFSSLSHYTLVQFHIKCEVLHQSCFERTIKAGKTVTKMRLSAFKSNKNNNKVTFALKT